MNILEKLNALRLELGKQGLHGFVIPMNDEFQSEYVPDAAKRIQFMTGFSGSAGTIVVLPEKAVFFTDGRYSLQAKEQVDSQAYSIMDSGTVTPACWVAEHLGKGQVLGFDPWLHTKYNADGFSLACQKAGGGWRACSTNPVDIIWAERPAPPAAIAIPHDIIYAGESSLSKRERIAAQLQHDGKDAVLLTLADSICWLLNIRGGDVHCTPFVLCYALLWADGTVDLFIEEKKLSDAVRNFLGNAIRIHSINTLEYFIKELINKIIVIDPSAASFGFFERFSQAGAVVHESVDPCQLPKACKNIVELEGMQTAHIGDGVAVCNLLLWLKNNIKISVISEIDVAEKLLFFRQRQKDFCYPSFDTIAGFASNGAIVHYHASEHSNKQLKENGLFLLDSGGQYHYGTTDITRTIAIGTATTEQKRRFTQVLKGHIAIAMAKFPEGTTGSQLDSLARYHLWQDGCDYNHGTGHGVGSFLSVHEGPQRISKAPSTIALKPGMIVSNEPGYYKAGEYGIRIESLVAVIICKEQKGFLEFTTLTRVPIDSALIDKELLTVAEINWLNGYHQKVYYDLLPYCNDKPIKKWLKDNTRTI